MDIKLLIGGLSFFGVVVGACLQYYFTKHIENQRHLRTLRSNAYMDYLKCVCEQAQFRYTEDTIERKQLFTKTGDAKARICLYGSSSAIQAFAKFEKLGASMATEDQRTAFTNMVEIMRHDSGGKKSFNPEFLQIVLLGYHPESTQQ